MGKREYRSCEVIGYVLAAVGVNGMEVCGRIKLCKVLKIMLKNPANWKSPIGLKSQFRSNPIEFLILHLLLSLNYYSVF